MPNNISVDPLLDNNQNVEEWLYNRTARYRFWRMLRAAHKDYEPTTNPTPEGFVKWVASEWGLGIGIESAGYSANYDILDERKYMLFVLKYSNLS